MRRNSNGSFFWNSSIVTKKPRYIYAITWNPHQRIVLTLLGNLSWFVLPFPGRWWSDDNSDVSTSYVTQILWEATGTLDLWEFSLTGVTREIRGHRCDRCEPAISILVPLLSKTPTTIWMKLRSLGFLFVMKKIMSKGNSLLCPKTGLFI